jgi:imidazolonepropionase-like amidohydrolase
MRKLLSCIALLCFLSSFSQETFPVNGAREKNWKYIAFEHATLHISDALIIQDATLLILGDRIVNAGQHISIPASTLKIDCSGKHIYPSFIDLSSNYGQPKVERGEWSPVPQIERTRKGAFGWNDAIHADYAASYHFQYQEDVAQGYLKGGFGAALTHQKDGIVRGSGCLVAFHSNEQKAMIHSQASAHYSFDKGSSKQEYPNSLMGSIALLRQTYYDAQWYKTTGIQSERNLSLESFLQLQNFPSFFDSDDKWNSLRADKIGDEFNVQYYIKGVGNEYQRLSEIKASKGSFILPVNFPGPIDCTDPILAKQIPLEEMKHWDWAPANASMLKGENIPFVFTADGLEDKSQFLSKLQKAAQYGLTEADVLAALTRLPAQWIQCYDRIGSLESKKYANFIITSHPLLSKQCQITENWVMGEKHEIEKPKSETWLGTYEISWDAAGSESSTIIIEKRPNGINGTWIQKGDTLAKSLKVTTDPVRMTIYMNHPKDSTSINHQYLTIQKTISGVEGVLLDGWNQLRNVKGTFQANNQEKKNKTDEIVEWIQPISTMTYPFGSYGRTQVPDKKTYWIQNATLWTNEPQGIIEGDLLIQDGKILQVGKVVAPANAIAINAKGMHVTPGIIDEHSHIALMSVNEGAQSSSAEVEESRVVWPEDIDIYRQLAGGVTASQLLHGSANAIGGQSALIKLRWGMNAEQMLIENAPGFIKFALGENVKQSNWGDFNRVRFPQTRMGVEQLYYDHFHQAREYGEAWKKYQSSIKSKSPIPAPRKDLEMEALHEILIGKRFITCHSYVQSEINMLMHVADSMGFKINTFTHILEGYKVADKMKAHGASASSFSDWWAYKMEVRDAIPYNGALLYEQGVNVGFNSDDAEMARRLNQEAAKAVKYGNVPEAEALKFVTLNPAKMLHLDHRMGSLSPGKDADVVIWNHSPLSIYAIAEKTFVDGRCLYDRSEENELHQKEWAERKKLMDAMQHAIENGEQPQKASGRKRRHFHCDSAGELFIIQDHDHENHH